MDQSRDARDHDDQFDIIHVVAFDLDVVDLYHYLGAFIEW